MYGGHKGKVRSTLDVWGIDYLIVKSANTVI